MDIINLRMHFQKNKIGFGLLVLGFVLLVFFRYEIVPIHGTGRAYRLDRWTGNVSLLMGVHEKEMVFDPMKKNLEYSINEDNKYLPLSEVETVKK